MTTHRNFPDLAPDAIAGTRDALHAYALVLGDYLASYRTRRKHWWHISLRPVLEGMTTGVIRAQLDFELVLNLRRSELQARIANGAEKSLRLHGQPAPELARDVTDFLTGHGLDRSLLPKNMAGADKPTAGYASDIAVTLGIAWNSIGATMEEFQAGIREETSPIQLWPHHFDLAMMWLPGETIAGQDPADEENADKQMNFGFTLGDQLIPEPYFYATAYPLPEAFPKLQLPAGTTWHTEGFSGAVLRYRVLTRSADPGAYLLDLWTGLLNAGRKHLLTRTG